LFVLGIIANLSGRVINNYFKNPELSGSIGGSLSSQVKTTGSYKSVADSARESVQYYNQRLSSRENYINNNIRKAHK
jgi:hypothetical protein